MNRESMPHRPLSRVLIPLLILAFASPLWSQCGDNEPALPVPECRHQGNGDSVPCTDNNAVRLWTDELRPGGTTLPADQLPPNRDSTQYREFSVPGFATGHELFHSLDIVNSHLYVVYNAGFQIWNIAGGNAEDPQRRFVRDGWRGDFLSFPSTGENDFYTDDIAGVDPTGGDSNVLVAISGKDGVGPTIWEHSPSPEGLEQLYQDLGVRTQRIRATEFNGTAYAFAGGFPGVFVYDMTRASTLTSPCLDNNGSVCPGVYKGKVGNSSLVQSFDIIERAGRIYVATGRGILTPLEIWEVVNPAAPTGAAERFSGLGGGVQAVELFEIGGDYYLAAVERVSTTWRLRIYNANSCLDTNGCTSLGSALWSKPVEVGSSTFLTFSTTGGTPFLYFGLMSNTLESTKVEGLFNLSTLGGTNQITEITDGGGTYTDSCSGNTVDYWGDYYAGNGHGLRNFNPRVGMFKGSYFYRVAFGLLDVHVADTGPGVPEVTTAVDDPPPHYMEHPIDFSATADNCDGPELWTWNDDDTVASTIDDNGSSATITFGLCAGADCPEREVEVWALKDACSSDVNLVEDRAMVTVMEPRPQIRGIDVCPSSDPGCLQVPVPEFPVCTVLRFTADLDGRPGFSYLWEARDAEGGLVDSSTQAVFDWDTSGVPLSDLIFADGFESGDVSAWDSSEGLPLARPRRPAPKRELAPSLRELLAKGGVSATFDVELTVSNADGNDLGAKAVTLTGLGALGFDAPAITVSDQGGGSFDFQANTQNATEWRWEIDDPGNGSTIGCLFYNTCQIIDWGQDDGEIGYVWQPPNTPGMYGVTVSIRNCVEEDPVSESVVVNVTEVVNPEPPVVTNFRVNDNDCSCALGFCECPLGQPITFAVTSTGDPDTYEFDWNGDGSFDTPTIPVGNPITHTYTTPGNFDPKVRAYGGTEVSATVTCQDTLIID